LIGIAGVAAIVGVASSRTPVLAIAIGTTPCAYLIAHDVSPMNWVRLVVFLAASLGSVAAARVDDAWGDTGVTPALFAIAAFGVFAAVPDVEEAATMLGAAVPIALLGWPFRLATLGRAGSAGATALLAWVVATGGRGRTPSVAGGLACLGLLVWLAFGQGMREHVRPTAKRRAAGPPLLALVLIAQGGIVFSASRVAGVSKDLGFAVVVAVASSAFALVAAGVIGSPATGVAGGEASALGGDALRSHRTDRGRAGAD
jgi:hypothetical protein